MQISRFSIPELTVCIVDRYNTTVSTAQVTYDGELGNGSLSWNATMTDYRTRLNPVTLEPDIYQLTIWVDWQGFSISQDYFIEVVDGSMSFTDPVFPSGWQNTSQIVVGITITDNLTGIQGNTIGYRLAYIAIGQNLIEQSWQALTGYSNAACVPVEETLDLLYDGRIQLEWRAKKLDGLDYSYSSTYTLFVDTQIPKVNLNYLPDYQRCGVQLILEEEEKGSAIEQIKINYQILNSSQWKQLELNSPQINEEIEVWIATSFPELLISVQVFDEAGNMFHSSPTHISLPIKLIPPSGPMVEILTFSFILGTFVSIRKFFDYKKQKEGFSVP